MLLTSRAFEKVSYRQMLYLHGKVPVKEMQGVCRAGPGDRERQRYSNA